MEMREASASKPGPSLRGRAIHVSPGKSVSFREIGAGSSGTQTKKSGVTRKIRVHKSDSESSLEETLSSSDEDMPEFPLEYEKEESSEKESEEEEGKTKEIKEGSYVVVRFTDKKANSYYHFVGKVLKKEKVENCQ